MKLFRLAIATMIAAIIGQIQLDAQRTLTLEDCRQMAIDNNKDLEQARDKIEMANLDKKIARSYYYPNLSATGTYQYNEKNINLINDEMSNSLKNIGTSAQGMLTSQMTSLTQAIMSNPLAAAEYANSPMWQTVIGALSKTDISSTVNTLGSQLDEAFHGEAFSKLETGALVRSTSDLTISIDMNGNDYSGEFQLGFSIKSAPKMSTKGGLKKKPVSYKSGRSWNEVGKALNLLNTEFEYYFANLVAKPTARSYSSGRLKNGTKSYQALKRYIGSGYALDAIAGTGSGTDLVTHAIYLNKIMTITDLLDELENKGDLNVNIGSVAQDSEFVDGDPLLAKYIRSRNVLAKIRNLAMTFSK